MNGIHRILHPTDFTTPSEAALRIAYSVARDYKAELVIFHVWEPMLWMESETYPPISPLTLEESLAKLAGSVAEGVLRRVKCPVLTVRDIPPNENTAMSSMAV
jgi:nucleotide-binding universal stress UspA family protein